VSLRDSATRLLAECGAIPALLALCARWRVGACASAGRPGRGAAAAAAAPGGGAAGDAAAALGAAAAAREAGTMLLRLLGTTLPFRKCHFRFTKHKTS
jgi:hypothetical protein